MNQNANVKMAVSYRYYKESKSQQYGKRSLRAEIQYDDFEAIADIQPEHIEQADEGGTPVSDIHQDKQKRGRQAKYVNYDGNIDMATFIRNAIQFLIHDATEQELRTVSLQVELSEGIRLPDEVAKQLAQWFSVDPMLSEIEFTSKEKELAE